MVDKRHRVPSRSVPPPQARDKLAFLLSLVPWLLEHDRVTVQDAAAHFGVTDEEIRTSVSLVALSGVPGTTSTYQHEDLFDIDWDAFEQDDEIAITQQVGIDDAPRLSAREAAAVSARSATSTRSASSRSTPTGICAAGATCVMRCAPSASTGWARCGSPSC